MAAEIDTHAQSQSQSPSPPRARAGTGTGAGAEPRSGIEPGPESDSDSDSDLGSETEIEIELGLDPLASETAALAFARGVIRAEMAAMARVADRLDGAVARVARRILDCPGAVLVTGVGKSGLVGDKIAATLASTGTRAFFLHPAEAIHGDLGRVRAGDVVLALSMSGETEEIVRLIGPIRALGATLVGVTATRDSALGRGADDAIALGPIDEACHLGLAPSSSTTALMAVGDAIALLVSRARGFRAEDFARYHPGGALGRKLTPIEAVMRSGRQLRVAHVSEIVRDMFARLGGDGRRTGAVLIVDDVGRLAGIFTDSDLARLFERGREAMIDRPIGESMTRDPRVVRKGSPIAEAIEILQSRKLSELPVLDEIGKPIGLVDITDLVGLIPPERFEAEVEEELELGQVHAQTPARASVENPNPTTRAGGANP